MYSKHVHMSQKCMFHYEWIIYDHKCTFHSALSGLYIMITKMYLPLLSELYIIIIQKCTWIIHRAYIIKQKCTFYSEWIMHHTCMIIKIIMRTILTTKMIMHILVVLCLTCDRKQFLCIFCTIDCLTVFNWGEKILCNFSGALRVNHQSNSLLVIWDLLQILHLSKYKIDHFI